MKIKVILHEEYTKGDIYGGVYHTVRVTNPNTNKSFTVCTCSLRDVEHILYQLFPKDCKSGAYPFYRTGSCTGSARISSLPESIYLDEYLPTREWKKELNKIGYRLSKA